MKFGRNCALCYEDCKGHSEQEWQEYRWRCESLRYRPALRSPSPTTLDALASVFAAVYGQSPLS